MATMVRGVPEQLVYEMLSLRAVAFYAFFHPPRTSGGCITRDMCKLVAGLFMLQSHAHFRLMPTLSPSSSPIACFLMYKVLLQQSPRSSGPSLALPAIDIAQKLPFFSQNI